MTVDEAFAATKNNRPQQIHVTGKTSTGKTTFARRLKSELGYAVIELDTVVTQAVIEPLNLQDRGPVLREVYKERGQLEWIRLFVDVAQQAIHACNDNNQPVVIDGAIANMTTLQELLTPFPMVDVMYFHPQNSLTYIQYLTRRFSLVTDGYDAGLPLNFWGHIDKSELRQFYRGHIITPGLTKSIADYAAASRQSSTKRLADIQAHFKEVDVVTI